jgi:putative membrane protein
MGGYWGVQPDPPAPPAPGRSGGDARVQQHLANQRTLLAWIRTSIALMGLGFVVARFALLLRGLAGAEGVTMSATPGLSSWIGVILVFTGVLAGVLGAVRYFRVRDQIERGTFEPDALYEIAVLAVLVLSGVALTIYLALSS